MIHRAFLLARILHLPLLAVVIPVQFALSLFGGRPWQLVTPVWTLAWSVLVTYAGLIALSAVGSDGHHALPPNALKRWLASVIVYVLLAAGISYTFGAARMVSAVIMIIAALAVLVLEFVLTILLALGPVLAALGGLSVVRAFRESFGIMTHNWRNPIAMLLLTALPLLVSMAAYYAIPWSAVPWQGAKSLLLTVIGSLTYLPALGLAVTLACPHLASSAERLHAYYLPASLRFGSAVLVPACLAAAMAFFLMAIIPVSAIAFGEWSGSVALNLFLPVTPIGFLLFALPGIWAGGLSERVWGGSGPSWFAGLMYGLLMIHIPLGAWPFTQKPLILFYVVGLVAHTAVTLAGAALSRKVHLGRSVE